MNQYYEGYVRARRILQAHETASNLADEVVIRHTVRFRVGLSLVNLGNHLMGHPTGRAEMRPAA